MSQEIELTIMEHSPDLADYLHPLLVEFEAQHSIRVKFRILSWQTGWSDLVQIAVRNEGPDISEVGSSWVSNLIAMNALRAFEANELQTLGGMTAFLQSAWQGALSPGTQRVMAIPWWIDTRILYYRRDILQRAGIDEQTAFNTREQFANTLERLPANNGIHPWSAPIRRSALTLHNAASWVWGAGGDFVSLDGRQTLFAHPDARRGFRAYFELARYLHPSARTLEEGHADDLFIDGRVALILSGPWTFYSVQNNMVVPEVSANLGMALPPGVPFIGGSSLVVWRHTRREKAALELIRFLNSSAVESIYPRMRLFPAHLGLLDASPIARNTTSSQLVSQGLGSGRSFPPIPLWGLIEENLVVVMANTWKEVLDARPPDLDELIRRQFSPLARRLDMTLSSTK